MRLTSGCLLILVLVSMVLSREPRCKHPAHRRRPRPRTRSTTSTAATDEMDYEYRDGDVYDLYAEYFRSKARLMAELRERHHRRRPETRSRLSGSVNQQRVHVQALRQVMTGDNVCHGVDCGANRLCVPSPLPCTTGLVSGGNQNTSSSNSGNSSNMLPDTNCSRYECMQIF